MGNEVVDFFLSQYSSSLYFVDLCCSRLDLTGKVLSSNNLLGTHCNNLIWNDNEAIS